VKLAVGDPIETPDGVVGSVVATGRRRFPRIPVEIEKQGRCRRLIATTEGREAPPSKLRTLAED
jgi:hypothetical protein